MEVPTGKHIKRWRKSLRLTQSQLSQNCGVPINYRQNRKRDSRP